VGIDARPGSEVGQVGIDTRPGVDLVQPDAPRLSPEAGTSDLPRAFDAADAASAPGDVFVPALPVNLALPQVRGQAKVGSLLTAAPGEWSSKVAVTTSFQWLRCNAAGNSCLEISGATSDSYTARNIDASSTLRVLETASAGPGASASARSAATSAVSAPTTCTNPTQTVGPLAPTVAVGRAASVTWTNPSSALVQDGTFAETQSLAPGEISDELTLSGFKVTVPPAATIHGVMFTVTRTSKVGNQIYDHLVKYRNIPLTLSNAPWGANPMNAAYGSPTDPLGITPETINADGLTFSMVVRNSGTESDVARVDAVRLTVYYTEATSTGPKPPTSVVDDASTGTVAWENPMAASPDVKGAAQAVFNQEPRSHRLLATGFGLALPAGKVPTGVRLHVSFDTVDVAGEDVRLALMKSGDSIGNDISPSSLACLGETCAFGGVDNLWQAKLTASDVADADFGVGLVVNHSLSGKLSVDDLALEIFYEPTSKQADFLPSTATSTTSSHVWENPAATGASVILTLGEFTDDLVLTGFGFSIPPNAIVTGISLQYEGICGNHRDVWIADKRIQLTFGGVPVCANKAEADDWTGGSFTRAYGSSTDTWGCAWDGATVNANDFGVIVGVRFSGKAGNNSAFVSRPKLTLTYCVP
jgi:hypothetical protein